MEKKRKINPFEKYGFAFKKKMEDVGKETEPISNVHLPSTSTQSGNDSIVNPETLSPSQDTQSTLHEFHCKYDVSNFVNTKPASDEILSTLQSLWSPNASFKFPSSARNLKFQLNWFTRWNWLAYSKKEDGAFCKYCIFFASDTSGFTNRQPLGQLVKKKFSNWKKAVECFKYHENTEYHKFSIIKAQNLALVRQKKMDPVSLQIDSAAKEKIEENRRRISPIVDTIIMCGRQNIPLRGHRDSGPILSENDPEENDGNFRAILRSKLRSGDKYLKLHLESMTKAATYISPRIQNEIIRSCGSKITNKLVKKIKDAKYFSILADETTDISTVEQFSLCVRIFNEETSKVEELFLTFVPVRD